MNQVAPQSQWYYFTRSATISTVGCQFFTTALICLCAEVTTLGSLFLIRYLAKYLAEEENDTQRAAILVGSFAMCTLLSSLLKNFYIYYGYVMSLEFRKIMVASIYDKVGKLSMRSLTQTNSGKLITLASSDIFTLERPLSMAPFALVAPLINLASYALIWHISGWQYALVIFGLWILMLLCQMTVARMQKGIK